MNFVSLEFLVFLAAVFIVYFAAPKKVKWVVLLIASYVFYWFSGPRNFIFIIFTTVTVFLGGLWLGKLWDLQRQYLAENDQLTAKEKKEYRAVMQKKRRLVLALILVLNFGIMIFLKYYNFGAETINSLFAAVGIGKRFPWLRLLLPLGISFYTFQSCGYIIDQYRGKYEPDRNIFKFALFVSFFPQIIQGPIGRYSDLAHQLYEPHSPDYRRCKFGLQLLIWGYFQKLVIADRLLIMGDNVFDNVVLYQNVELWVSCLLQGVQLYCDFAGGINIVRGAAQILGIDMAENFQQPFFATSLSDFWRRWHMSLGDWMKDYLFYPIAMSKPVKKLSRACGKRFNLTFGSLITNCIPSLIVFFLIGLWHGATWQYVVFGLYNGIIISVSTLLTPVYTKLNTRLGVHTERFSWRLWQMLRTLFLATISRMIVRTDTWESTVALFKGCFTGPVDIWALFDGTLFNLGLGSHDFLLAMAALLILLAVGVLHERGVHIRQWLDGQGLILRWTVMIAAILAVLIFGIYGPAFNASEFIYQAF